MRSLAAGIMCFQELNERWTEEVAVFLGDAWEVESNPDCKLVTAISKSIMRDAAEHAHLKVFPNNGDATSKHRHWRRALCSKFVCNTTMMTVVVANVHTIAGSRDDDSISSHIPGKDPETRSRFKATALRNVIVQAYEALSGTSPASPPGGEGSCSLSATRISQGRLWTPS